MRRARRATATLALLAALAAARPAPATDFGRAAVGTSGSEFLLLDTSARGVALGGAMSAATDDATSLYWNPAGLARVPRLSASVLHAQYVADITYDAGAYAQRINDTSVLGAGVRYLNGGDVPRTDVNGIESGSFQPRSYVAEFGWGQSVYDLSDSEMDMALGVTLRAIRTELGLASANGYGGDFGIQSRFYTSALTYDVAMAVQNVGTGQRFDRVRDSLPLRVRFGGSVRPAKELALVAEAVAPVNDAPYGAAGVEYGTEIERGVGVAARAGLNTLTYQSLGLASTLSFGLGATFNDVSFDYAFVPMGALGTATHRLSVSFNLPAKASRRYRQR